MHICLTAERTAGVAVLPVVMVPGNMVLQRGIGGTNEVGLVIALVVAVAHGHIFTALEVAGAVAAVLIGLSRAGDGGSHEGAIMYPATLNGRIQTIILLTFHTDTVLGYVSEGKVSYLKALAVACRIVGCLADEVKTPAVDLGIVTDTLDGDILTARHTSHKAVITYRSTEINAVVLCKTVDLGGRRTHVCAARTLNAADNTDYEGCAVCRQLTKNILVGVSRAALGVKAAAHVHTGRAENVTDTRNGCAVLGGYGYAILVLVGNVKNDCVVLESTVVFICADTLGVIEVSIARTVVGKHLDTARGNISSAGGDGERIGTRLKAWDIYAHYSVFGADEILEILSCQAS